MVPAERESNARDEILAALNAICPHVVGNRFIPHWPLPSQALFLGLHTQDTSSQPRVFQALYGGAAGGGKSDALLMAAAQYVHCPEFAGILFRRTFTDLAQPGALMDRAMQWWLPRGVHWDGTNKIFRFPSGAKVAMAYLSNPNDHLRYQGAEYQFTGWDELTQWPTAAPYEYVGLSRVRRHADSTVPLRTLSASNPGGPGHVWVLRKFVGGPDPVTGEQTHPEHPYIPARIMDNPHLDRDAYVEGLMMLHPTVREQLLNGDWRARDPGDYFRSEWFGPLLNPDTEAWATGESIRIRWWDLAASEKPDAARTAGVLMARHRHGVRAIEHARTFRATPGKRDDLIVQQAQTDGFGTIVGIEIEPGSGGPAQFAALEKRLRSNGFHVVGARPQATFQVEPTDAERRTMMRTPVSATGKAARADPVASCLERGYQRRGECPDTGAPWWGADADKHPHEAKDGLRMFMGPWVRDYLDEVEGFPDAEICDLVDATSGAWSWLEAHPMGGRVPPSETRKQPPPAEMANVHPVDRDEYQAAEGRDRTGKWRP
jgi:phage terminase large subunit-like protein